MSMRSYRSCCQLNKSLTYLDVSHLVLDAYDCASLATLIQAAPSLHSLSLLCPDPTSLAVISHALPVATIVFLLHDMYFRGRVRSQRLPSIEPIPISCVRCQTACRYGCRICYSAAVPNILQNCRFLTLLNIQCQTREDFSCFVGFKVSHSDSCLPPTLHMDVIDSERCEDQYRCRRWNLCGRDCIGFAGSPTLPESLFIYNFGGRMAYDSKQLLAVMSVGLQNSFSSSVQRCRCEPLSPFLICLPEKRRR